LRVSGLDEILTTMALASLDGLGAQKPKAATKGSRAKSVKSRSA
jgi:hypothetical protein